MASFGTSFFVFTTWLSLIGSNTYDNIVPQTDTAVKVATSIASFANANVPEIADKNFSSGIWTLVNGSDLSVFSKGMASFGTSFFVFTTWLSLIGSNTYDNIVPQTDTAVKVATSIASFANANVPEIADKNFSSGIWTLVNGSDLSVFSKGMASFGAAFKSFTTSLSGIDGDAYDNIVSQTDTAVKAATSIATFANANVPEIADKNFSSGIWTLVNGSDLSVFSEGMADLGTAFKSFATSLSGIGDDTYDNIESQTDTAIRVATAIAKFSKDELPKPNLKNFKVNLGLFSFSAEMSDPTSDFAKDLAAFGNAFNLFATALSSIENPPTQEQVNTAVACAQIVATFLSTVSEMNLPSDKNDISVFLSGDTSINTFLTKLVEFATSVKKAANELTGFSSDTSTAKADLNVAVEFIERMMGIMGQLCKNASGVVTENDVDNLLKVLDHVIGSIGTIKDQLVEFNSGLDRNEFDTLSVKLLLDSVSGLFRSVSGLNTKTWLSDLDADDITETLADFIKSIDPAFKEVKAKLDDYVLNLSAAGSNISDALTGITASFNGAGKDYALGLAGNYEWYSEVTPFTESTQLQLNAVTAFKSRFRVAGQDFSIGLANGLNDRKQYVIKAAKVLADGVLEKVREVFNEHSPSKEANEIGRYFDKGLADGFRDGGSETTRAAKEMALDALHGVKDTLLALSTLIADGVDVDPVIRPVVDLSGVTAGAQAIGGMLGGSQTIPVDTSARLAGSAARAAAASAAARRGTEAHARPSAQQPAGDQVNVTGNTFVIRDEQDIYSLASEIASLMYRQQRSVGAY